RIVIISAGAAGPSAAYWLGQASQRANVQVDMDVFEAEAVVRARFSLRVLTAWPYGYFPAFAAVELGADAFLDTDLNLNRAVKEFNLTTVNFRADDTSTGIWDGRSFLLQTRQGTLADSWRNGLKRAGAMGFCLLRPKTAGIDDAIWRRLYSASSSPWANMADLVSAMNASQLLDTTALGYLDSAGVDPRFSREIAESSTRELYGKNIDDIHAFGALHSMRPMRRRRVDGGNARIFESFLLHSPAAIHLKSRVTALEKVVSTSGETVWGLRTTRTDYRDDNPTAEPMYRTRNGYAHVILAAPHSTASIPLPASYNLPDIEFARLHVTLLTTTAPFPNPEYFSAASGTKIPQTIFTTRGYKRGEIDPGVYSLSYVSQVVPTWEPVEGMPIEWPEEETPIEWVVRIVPKDETSDSWLGDVFGADGVRWWGAYPEMAPHPPLAPVRLDDGLWYTGSLEPMFSSMEGQTTAARNVVELLFEEEFGKDLCGAAVDKTSWGSGRRYHGLPGWDCWPRITCIVQTACG
ncbi:hypothetical protein BOTBODRAFT_120434, partial [Botryobasidium botryosum FD-172 SS1]